MKFKSFVPLVIVLSILSASGANAVSVPVAFYHAEGNGKDETGQHNATLSVTDVNNPGLNFTTGKVGQAFAFTGLINVGGSQTGTYVDFGAWWTFESFSVAMWIRDDATAPSPQAASAPVMQLLDNANGTDWSITYNNSGNQYIYTSSDGVQIPFNTTPGTWQHLTITRDGATHLTSIYLNGQIVGTGT